MSTYFISDLHLCDQQPQITKRFIQFCQSKARQARALYILGDLFEYWLGDDVLDKTSQTVKMHLQKLSEHGVDVYFIAGNRDFLLGQDYANSCGMKLLKEPHVIELNKEKILLIHGDAECTDDIAYQQVRTMLRDSKWQQQFLAKSIEERIVFAQNAREQSQKHTKNAMSGTEDIMDVNQYAIEQQFDEHDVELMIHGHTHRPGIHQHQQRTRIVLGDWHHQVSYLKLNDTGFELIAH